MKLRSLDTQLFPSIAYAFPHGSTLPDPQTFPPVRNQSDLDRPADGLWCSPITNRDDAGAPTSTEWTDWCQRRDGMRDWEYLHPACGVPYDQIVTVEPLPGARIYQISTSADLDQLVEEYPLPDLALMRRSAPDWEALAQDGWDAVYASPEGVAANAHRFVVAEPSLANWECASVLWLRSTYRLGRVGTRRRM